ncbi:MAG: hydantoinase/oxoprolinase family protein, partial [Alphaproteobacteria bacterium]
AGLPNLISIDIGGTSADVCLFRDGQHAVTTRGRIGDWPLQTPMIDITTIGAGGGSIARVSPGGGLAVGPESAGAVPGPACYGRGATEPTVTDAHLVLGRLCPALLDDAFPLDRDAARDVVRRRVAEPLGISVERAAEGILEVVDHAMVGAIRLVSVERGFDPRDFALLAFGGAGPLHGGALARLLGMQTIIIPPAPGVLSAYGLLVADIRNDLSRTCFEPPPNYDLDRIRATLADLERQAKEWLIAEQVPAADRETTWHASFRYAHQGFELTVPWSGKSVVQAKLRETIDRFHRLHEQLYTFSQTDTPVELVTLHVTATGHLKRPRAFARSAAAKIKPTPIGRQTMHVGGRNFAAPIYQRAHLAVGAKVRGPAIVAQLDATTVLLPGQVGSVHSSGALIVTET